MYGVTIGAQMARTNRNLLFTNLAILALILTYSVVTSALAGKAAPLPVAPAQTSATVEAESIQLEMGPPIVITRKDLASDSRLKQLKGKMVRLTDADSIDLKFPVWNLSQRSLVRDINRQPTYRASKLSDRLFVILPEDASTGKTYTGHIRALEDQDKSQVTTILNSRGVRTVNLAGYALDCLPRPDATVANVSHTPVNIHVPNLLYMLLCAVPIWNIAQSLMRSKNPGSHPIARRLATYGSIPEIVQSIDGEWRAGVIKITPVNFTSSWLIAPTFFSCVVVPLDEIMWMFERTYVTRGRSYSICLRDRQGHLDEFTVGLFQVKKILEYFGKVRPWAVVGYNGQLAVDFASNRARFIADVEARRRQMQGGRP